MPTRLDVALVDRGLAVSRTKAQALIAAGMVSVGGRRAESAARPVGDEEDVVVAGPDHPWASRAGVKLAGAVAAWNIDCSGRIALDAGASTGGFVSVLLDGGATLVYAVDVGHGQLITSLATDERVRVMDRVNIRTLERLDGPAPDLVTADLSFISLRAVLPNLVRLAPGAEMVALFKPQFEVGRDNVGAGGIVKDAAVVARAIEEFTAWAEEHDLAFPVDDAIPSALRGSKGNQEWLLHLRLGRHDG